MAPGQVAAGNVASAAAAAISSLSSPERDAASALLLQSLQPNLELGPAALGSRQSTDNFFNDMLQGGGGGDGASEKAGAPSLTMQSSVAPLHVQTSLGLQHGWGPAAAFGSSASPVAIITDDVEKLIHLVHVKPATGGPGSGCPCFDKDGVFLGVYRQTGMSVVFWERSKVSCLLGGLPVLSF
jgi:hypothetical protein